jgi:hypothetical protein
MELYDEEYYAEVRRYTELLQREAWRDRDNLIQIMAHQRAMIVKYDKAFDLVRRGLLVLGPYWDDEEP